MNSRGAGQRAGGLDDVRRRTKKEGDQMEYRIVYHNGQCHNYAYSRKGLIEWLKLLKDETITEIRKIYRNGVEESVIEKYRRYIK